MEDNLKDGNEKDIEKDKKLDKESTENINENENVEEQSEEKTAEEIRYTDFYVKLRKRIDKQLKDSYNKTSPVNSMINLLAILPDLFHLCTKLVFDGKVHPDKKGALIGSLLYVVSPIDLIPDIIPVFGFVDDLLVVTLGLNSMLDDTKDEYLKTSIQQYWAGDKSVYEILRHIIAVTDSAVEFLPKKILKLVKDLMRGK
jgi:uncharacterized membrane protein YkvA (DUF1232 family)